MTRPTLFVSLVCSSHYTCSLPFNFHPSLLFLAKDAFTRAIRHPRRYGVHSYRMRHRSTSSFMRDEHARSGSFISERWRSTHRYITKDLVMQLPVVFPVPFSCAGLHYDGLQTSEQPIGSRKGLKCPVHDHVVHIEKNVSHKKRHLHGSFKSNLLKSKR